MSLFLTSFIKKKKKSYSIWIGILGSRNIIYTYSWTPEILPMWSEMQLDRFLFHNIQPAH